MVFPPTHWFSGLGEGLVCEESQPETILNDSALATGTYNNEIDTNGATNLHIIHTVTSGGATSKVQFFDQSRSTWVNFLTLSAGINTINSVYPHKATALLRISTVVSSTANITIVVIKNQPCEV